MLKRDGKTVPYGAATDLRSKNNYALRITHCLNSVHYEIKQVSLNGNLVISLVYFGGYVRDFAVLDG